MSRTTHPSLLRSLSLAGILTAVALVAVPPAHGQEGERALLNPVSALARGLATYEVAGMSVNGERALLGHVRPDLIVEVSRSELLAWDTPAHPIDGAEALMGRRTTIDARPTSVSTKTSTR
jgi:hypothetical protein